MGKNTILKDNKISLSNEMSKNTIQKRKRNKKNSPISRGEKEILKKILHFREEKEEGILFSQDSRGEQKFF